MRYLLSTINILTLVYSPIFILFCFEKLDFLGYSAIWIICWLVFYGYIQAQKMGELEKELRRYKRVSGKSRLKEEN